MELVKCVCVCVCVCVIFQREGKEWEPAEMERKFSYAHRKTEKEWRGTAENNIIRGKRRWQRFRRTSNTRSPLIRPFLETQMVSICRLQKRCRKYTYIVT